MESDMTTMVIFLILCGGAVIILSGMSYGMMKDGSDTRECRKERRQDHVDQNKVREEHAGRSAVR